MSVDLVDSHASISVETWTCSQSVQVTRPSNAASTATHVEALLKRQVTSTSPRRIGQYWRWAVQPATALGGRHLHVWGKKLHLFGKSGIPQKNRKSRSSGVPQTCSLVPERCRVLPPGRRAAEKRHITGQNRHILGCLGISMICPRSFLGEMAKQKIREKTGSPWEGPATR